MHVSCLDSISPPANSMFWLFRYSLGRPAFVEIQPDENELEFSVFSHAQKMELTNV